MNVGTFKSESGVIWQSVVKTRSYNSQACTRLCPNPKCRKIVFTLTTGADLIQTFPSETLDFDGTGLPDAVRGALEEAINCHAAKCFRAAAIMIRRTLEEICMDKGTSGRDLKAKIVSLGTLITLPQALLDATDHLRLLGNDAAHIEAKTYEKVGIQEVEVGILLAKELVKATYQYEDLLSKLKALSRA